ncbi:M48 family metalloprotease [Streptosporangium sp. NPDC023963]|uniref:M48 family metalloprotease n=1 Tax=Streptosporangium sp. NPDC023963 TaxID=3155608 RepID=UPI00344837FC
MILLRALLSLSLLAGLYALSGLLVVGYVFLLVMTAYPALSGSRTIVPALMTLSFLPVVLGTLRAVFFVGVSTSPREHAVRVSPDDAPALWEMIGSLAGKVGTAPPEEVYLDGQANASVEEQTRMLGLVGGRRRIHIGVPLLIGMSVDEFQAVLCHELGHYAHRHTRLTAITYRCGLALRRVLQDLTDMVHNNRLTRFYAIVVIGIVSALAFLYGVISFGVRRRQEIEADAAMVEVVGKEVAGRALRMSYALGVLWAEFQNDHLDPMRRRKGIPEDVFDDYRRLLDAPDSRSRLAELRDNPPVEKTEWRDSHPSLVKRLKWIDRYPDGREEVDPTSAMTLLLDRNNLLQAVQRHLRSDRLTLVVDRKSGSISATTAITIVFAILVWGWTNLASLSGPGRSSTPPVGMPVHTQPTTLTPVRPSPFPPPYPDSSSLPGGGELYWKIPVTEEGSVQDVACSYATKVSDLIALNHLSRSDRLSEGQIITIPRVPDLDVLAECLDD